MTKNLFLNGFLAFNEFSSTSSRFLSVILEGEETNKFLIKVWGGRRGVGNVPLKNYHQHESLH